MVQKKNNNDSLPVKAAADQRWLPIKRKRKKNRKNRHIAYTPTLNYRNTKRST